MCDDSNSCQPTTYYACDAGYYGTLDGATVSATTCNACPTEGISGITSPQFSTAAAACYAAACTTGGTLSDAKGNFDFTTRTASGKCENTGAVGSDCSSLPPVQPGLPNGAACLVNADCSSDCCGRSSSVCSATTPCKLELIIP
ncbi:MAG: hypothetical protein LBO08_02865 [Rickettsiales bacterium]|nr:hypothetical protein [Rickettsiales bacterium]